MNIPVLYAMTSSNCDNDKTSNLTSNIKLISEIMERCRVCMGRDWSVNTIFEEVFKNNISDKMQYCTGIQVTEEDGLPKRICNLCYKDLIVAHKFKSTCLHSDREFRKLLLGLKVKTETETDRDDYEDAEEKTFINVDDEEIKDELLEAVLTENDSRVNKVNKLNCDIESPSDLENPTRKVKRKYTKRDKQEPCPVRTRKKFQRLFCVPCEIKFKTKVQSDEHKKLMHNGDTWVCEICGKVFSHRGSHYTHVRSHLPPAFACAHCDYRTSHKHDLRKHLRTHSGEKQYQCEFCTAAYHASSNLISHIRRNHEGLKRFNCPICDHKFFEKSKLTRHLDSHNDIKRFTCEVCHAQFSRRCYWKKHLHRQHGIVIPTTRPGRQKTNFIIGQESFNVTENAGSAE